MLEEEGMIKGARAGQGKHEAIGRGGSWEMAAELTDEQKKAVTHVLGSRDGSGANLKSWLRGVNGQR